MTERVRAIWAKVWGRGVSITFEFGGFDGGRDKCPACGKERRFHRRSSDHAFVEKEK